MENWDNACGVAGQFPVFGKEIKEGFTYESVILLCLPEKDFSKVLERSFQFSGLHLKTIWSLYHQSRSCVYILKTTSSLFPLADLTNPGLLLFTTPVFGVRGPDPKALLK
ncbi:hypothetical protein XENOCAPTIV_003888, partial [Xenoophorus captivus]